MKIGFLGYGEAARAFHEGLSEVVAVVLAHDILLLSGDEAMRLAMSARGAQVAETAAALGDVDLIFSAVTADQSLLAVQPLLPHLRPGQVFIDINSVSPERKRQTAAAVEAAGAEYIDMAVMAPVHPRKHRTPVLLAGSFASEILPELRALGFSAEIAGDAPGAATAIKMVRSVFVKGLEAITVEALLAAQASGCFDEILASLSGSYPASTGRISPNTRWSARHGTDVVGQRRCARARRRWTRLASMAAWRQRLPRFRSEWVLVA